LEFLSGLENNEKNQRLFENLTDLIAEGIPFFFPSPQKSVCFFFKGSY
jgi:hypothetical protein